MPSGRMSNPSATSTLLGGKDRGASSYALNRRPGPGLKPKDLIGIPWRVALALQADGWYLRSDVIWSKPNPMPESVTDRPTRAHEYLFVLTKRERYFWDQEAVREKTGRKRRRMRFHRRTGPDPVRWSGNSGGDADQLKVYAGVAKKKGGHAHPNGRNLRSVWQIATQSYSGAHFATFPEALVERCLLAGTRPGDTVLDPFAGSGTVAKVAIRHNRNSISIDLSEDYADLQLGQDERRAAPARSVGTSFGTSGVGRVAFSRFCRISNRSAMRYLAAEGVSKWLTNHYT